jgi:hypothetical protein
MTQLQERLIIALDEWLGIALLAWLDYRHSPAFKPVLVAFVVLIYAISYPSYWYRWWRTKK